MSTYLKLFETTAEYTQYIESAEALHPNTSLCLDTEKVHYEPLPEDDTDLVVIKVINDYSVPTVFTLYRTCEDDHTSVDPCNNTGEGSSAFYGLNNFSEMKINDGAWQPAEKTAELPPGENIIRFRLIDDTFIPAGVFKFEGISGFITYISIPKSVTKIEYEAFITAQNYEAQLAKLVIYAETPPAAVRDYWGQWNIITYYTGNICKIYVPDDSLEAYQSARDTWAVLHVDGIYPLSTIND